jgi:hypothetical protein
VGHAFSFSGERSSPSTPANKFLWLRRDLPLGNKPKKLDCLQQLACSEGATRRKLKSS